MKVPFWLPCSIALLPALACAQPPAVPDWMLPSSPTHKQVPSPAGYHPASKVFAEPIGIFTGQADIGGPLVPGSASFDAGAYRIVSAGYNVFYTHDECRYLWVKRSGDVSLAATIGFPRPGFGDRKALLIIRQDLSDDAPEAMVALHGAGLIHLAQRPAKGALVKAVQRIEVPKQPKGSDPLAVVSPVGERIGIEKHGDAFTLWVSLHGEPMHPYGAKLEHLTLKGPFYVGIAFCSHQPAHADEAVLSHVVLEDRAGAVR